MATQIVAEKVIRVDVVTSAAAQRNIKLLADEVSRVEKNTNSMKSSLEGGFGSISNVIGKLTGVLATFGIGTTLGALAKQVLEAASAYQVLEARLKLVLTTQSASERATRDVVQTAVDTGREIDSVAKLYEKAARAAQQFGISQGDVAKITRGFADSIRLSGASTQEAYAATVQFGQALASGRLQGDEFRSLMENNSVFMYEFAKAAGVSVAQLRKMGTEGKLNAQFLFEMMLKQGKDGLNMLERLTKQAEAMPLTFQQSLNSLGTQTTELIGELAKALDMKTGDQLGIFGPLIRSIREVTKAIKEARQESDNMSEGFFARWMRANGAAMDASGLSDVLPFGAGIYSRMTKPGPESTGEVGRLQRLTKEAGRLQTELNGIDAELAKLEVVPEERRTADQQDRFTFYTKKAQDLQRAINGINQTKLEIQSYEDPRLKREEKSTITPAGPSDEDLKKLKTAREALKDYIEKLREENEALKAVRDGTVESLRQGKQEEELKRRLKDAQIALNSSQAKGALALIRENASLKEYNAEMERFKKARDDAIQKNGEYNAKIQETIDRDQAAIEALQNKTKATQEYSSNRMKAELEQLQVELGFNVGTPFQKYIEGTIALLEQALAKRRELEGLQATVGNAKIENKQLGKDERQLQQDADQITNSITRNLANAMSGKGGTDIGEQLWQNIQDTFREKVIELTFKPILDPISRALAMLADRFAEDMAMKMALSFNTSGLGSWVAKLLGTADPAIGPPAPTGAVGIERVPYDGFLVALHRGERVQTAAEANDYRRARASGSMTAGVSINPQYTISIDSRSDAEAIAADTRRAIAQGNQDLVEELRSRGLLP